MGGTDGGRTESAFGRHDYSMTRVTGCMDELQNLQVHFREGVLAVRSFR